MTIDKLSYIPLFIELYLEKDANPIAIGTAFSVKYDNSNFLITNHHCVTGRNPDTGKPINKNGLADPKFMKVWFHTEIPGVWEKMIIRILGENGHKFYHEHPKGSEIDVVAINFVTLPGIKASTMDLSWADSELAVYPAKDVSIIGFPNGLTSGRLFPIWKKGHIASEPDIDFEDKPMFLIDATTRSGMSGSPVMIREIGRGQFKVKDSLKVEYREGDFCKFLGIYSGRVDKDSELGRVWKPIVIHEIIDNFRKNKQPTTMVAQPTD